MRTVIARPTSASGDASLLDQGLFAPRTFWLDGNGARWAAVYRDAQLCLRRGCARHLPGHRAVAHSQDYVLILGTAIPGYHAPEEITLPPAMRGLGVFTDLLETAREAGKLNLPPEYAELAHELQQMLGEWRREYDIAAPEPVLHLALVVWGQLHGLVSLEIFNQLQPVGSDPGALYRFEVTAILKRLLIE